MWRHRGAALWRHSCGAWHNCLFLTTASNVNCWADVANHVAQLWQAGDTEKFERITASYGPYVSRSRAAQSRDKTHKALNVYNSREIWYMLCENKQCV